jgi:hypothetical protein
MACVLASFRRCVKFLVKLVRINFRGATPSSLDLDDAVQ